MAHGPRYRVKFRRQREGKTDYRYRLRQLKSEMPRAVVRLTNRRILVSLEEFDPAGDKVLAFAESPELVDVGFPTTSLTSTPAAYLTGYLAGLRLAAKGEKEAVLDAGVLRPSKGGRILGALQGLLDAGVEIPHSKEGMPPKERLGGAHLKSPLSVPLDQLRQKVSSTLVTKAAAPGAKP
ncbi:MAG: 50S ribosomal protein L18 [Euryarchaeota archaeon]|nr:50S ribosomal protein L18 [Euryarchaeota archaeon]MDE1835720.1 50S ribosomal protein L18 [Euryarchaeota archaeon]MDE1880855.1 50S ribosomal protein L18 [Euryarchaeota archaeon]MDE2043911.1 50S ribosomal protein L18 [Thermoplasmata archaeon]